MRRYHDMGGQPEGPIDTADHATEPWAKTLTAILGALRAHAPLQAEAAGFEVKQRL